MVFFSVNAAKFAVPLMGLCQ